MAKLSLVKRQLMHRFLGINLLDTSALARHRAKSTLPASSLHANAELVGTGAITAQTAVTNAGSAGGSLQPPAMSLFAEEPANGNDEACSNRCPRSEGLTGMHTKLAWQPSTREGGYAPSQQDASFR